MTYPEHIQWIIDNRGEDLAKALSQDNSYKTIDNPLSVFLDADPTDKKKLTQWLVDTYISGGFRWEDIQSGSKSKVFDTLSLYIKHKSKLDSSNRNLQVNANDISQYDTLGSMYKDIASFVKTDKSSRSAKRDEQARAYEESEVLIKSDAGEFTKNALTVVIPKTEYASRWWGRGTQWCTAGDNNNVFKEYYEDGPLIVIIINGVKTQLHIDLSNKDGSVQFMDEHDRKVELKFIEDNWNLLSPIMEWALKKNGGALEYIPEYLRTAELYLEAVSQSGWALCAIPEHLKTAELCLRAVKQNGLSLYYVPGDLSTVELCLEAVRQDGMVLEYVPEPLRTAELCLEAVKQNGYALNYIPDHLRTAELCLEAIRQNGYALDHVPEYLRTAELCLEAIKNDGMALGDVPEHLRTAELCLEAVRQYGMALEYVPERLRKEELCLVAVIQNGRALGYVPERLRKEELCLKAIRNNGLVLVHVPENLKTAELCLEGVRQNGLALMYVPGDLRTEELCLEAVKQNGYALKYVPETLKTPKLCLEAVRQSGKALCFVPESLRTAELCLEAVKKDNINYDKKWDYSVLEELKLQLNISNSLDNNKISIKQ